MSNSASSIASIGANLLKPALAKTTSRLIEACPRLGGAREAPDTGSLRGDVYALASYLAEQLQTASWSAVVPSIIDAAERDADISAMQTGWQKALMAPFDAVVERAKAKGELPADTAAGFLIAATVGPLFYRRWFSKEPIDDRFVSAIAAAAVAAASG